MTRLILCSVMLGAVRVLFFPAHHQAHACLSGRLRALPGSRGSCPFPVDPSDVPGVVGAASVGDGWSPSAEAPITTSGHAFAAARMR